MSDITNISTPWSVKVNDVFVDIKLTHRDTDIVICLGDTLIGQAFHIWNRIDVVVAGDMPLGALRKVTGFVDMDAAVEYCLRVKGLIVE